MSPYIVTVNHPNTPNTYFDLEYYLSKHLPLALATWAPFGVKLLAVSSITDPAAPYRCQCVLEWDSAAGWEQAKTSERSVKVWADVPASTDVQVSMVEGVKVA